MMQGGCCVPVTARFKMTIARSFMLRGKLVACADRLWGEINARWLLEGSDARRSLTVHKHVQHHELNDRLVCDKKDITLLCTVQSCVLLLAITEYVKAAAPHINPSPCYTLAKLGAFAGQCAKGAQTPHC
jgi:hypothetical protein